MVKLYQIRDQIYCLLDSHYGDAVMLVAKGYRAGVRFMPARPEHWASKDKL